jgi:signal transduction histidine kinase
MNKKNYAPSSQNNDDSTHVNFSVDSQLIGELGERLVASNYIALSELIKNAYDADSPSVKVELINITKTLPIESSITIVDEGTGMTFNQIKDFWMKIATPHKSKNPHSKKYGRPVTGNKGIGRFACQKLAEKLEMRSVAKDKNEFIETTVTFNWNDFVPGKDIDTIPCKYSIKKIKGVLPGVTLKLINLREKWTERDYKMLLKSIAFISVASPQRREKFQEDPGFKSVVKCEEFSHVDYNVGKNILNAGWGFLKGKVSDDGILNLTLKCKGFERGVTHKLTAEKQLADLSFEIYVVPSSSKYKIENRRNPSILTNELLRKIRETQAGIRLYLNTFRVYPYGDIEVDDDWLGIARDIGKRRAGVDELLEDIAKSLGVSKTRAMLTHPSAQSLVGSVEIKGKSTKAFSAKMNREGLIENKAFHTLRNLLRLSLDWMALYHDAFIRNELKSVVEETYDDFTEGAESTNTTPQEKVDLAIEVIKQATLNYGKNDVSEDFYDEDIRAEEQRPTQTLNIKLTKASEVIQTTVNALTAELDTLRSVASTASLLFVFSHEFKSILSTLLGHAAKLENIAGKLQDTTHKNSLMAMANDARTASEQYTKITKLFDVFSDSKNFQGKKALLKVVIEQIKGGFDYLLSSFSIEMTSNTVSPVLKMPRLNEAEVYSILINAISNSVKAVIAVKGKRKIQVVVDHNDTEVTINVLDTGVGLNKAYWKDVFAPFISDPENKIYSVLSDQLGDAQLSTLGKGSGLGLHIVKSIVTKHKGSVEFVSAPSGWKTCLQIKLPK